MKRKTLVAYVIFACSLFSLAIANDHLRTRPFQLSLIYPLGTNGVNALDYSNVMSLNLVYGLNGGVSGTEIGIVFNYIHYNMNGVQIGGVANIVRRNTNGVSISAATNLNLGPTKGIGITGALNLTGGHADGLFIAGAVNLHLRTLDGVSIAGGVNVALGDAEGFTVAPVNVFLKDYQGVQIGVVNMVNKLDGLQVGVVNVVNDGTEALPIGLVSFVKNGYFEIEYKYNELSYFNTNFKMGVPKFYNVYSMGYSYYEGAPVFRYGLGFGTSQPVRYRHRVAFELTEEQVIRNWNWMNNLSLMTTFRMDYRIRIGDSFTLVLGPSCNALITNQLVNGEYGNMRLPKTFYEYEWTTTKLFAWFGWGLGFSYLL